MSRKAQHYLALLTFCPWMYHHEQTSFCPFQVIYLLRVFMKRTPHKGVALAKNVSCKENLSVCFPPLDGPSVKWHVNPLTGSIAFMFLCFIWSVIFTVSKCAVKERSGRNRFKQHLAVLWNVVGRRRKLKAVAKNSPFNKNSHKNCH